jgi:glutathione peroxidase
MVGGRVLELRHLLVRFTKLEYRRPGYSPNDRAAEGFVSDLPMPSEQSKNRVGGKMTKVIAQGVLCLLFCAAALMAWEKTVFDFTLNTIDGQPAPLASFKGKVVMLVNVASRCGYTPQYSALESIYEKYKDRGFVIVGIPANNFGAQEPGTNQQIKTFCSTKYNVTFPMMSKVSVKGRDKAPLYQFLTDRSASPKTGGEIQWNFTKFLVGPDGQVITRFEPEVTPDSPQITGAIEKALAALSH